jgi:uncharacterized protein DUF4349
MRNESNRHLPFEPIPPTSGRNLPPGWNSADTLVARMKSLSLVMATGLALLLVLSGCDKPSSVPAPAAAPAPPRVGGFAVASRAAPKLAYSHDLQLEMPATSIKSRYDRAVDRCLNDAKLNCVVLKTEFSTGEQLGMPRPSASLTVRLPHDAVGPFEEDLLAPVAGEAQGDAVLRSSSTVADDLTDAIEDMEQRQAQLTDYRDRLAELSKRPDVKVEDLIKIESELSNTQSQLEEIAAQKKALDQRVDTESLSIYFAPRDVLGNFSDPIVRAWHQASRVLGDSTATALNFVVAALPWLPIAAIGLLLIRLVFRRWRR